MNPAFSVIFFTTVSGVGYGLLAWLGLGLALGFPVVEAVDDAALLRVSSRWTGGVIETPVRRGRGGRYLLTGL